MEKRFTTRLVPRDFSGWEEVLLKGPGPLIPQHFKPGLDRAQGETRAAFLDTKLYNYEKLSDFLKEEQADMVLTPSQEKYLNRIVSEKALFVITGQQPGLLGGPIYWLYKALSCVALARHMEKELGRLVVPLFWIADDDSDIRECNHIHLVEPDAEYRGLSLKLEGTTQHTPVGTIPFGRATSRLLEQLGDVWSSETINFIKPYLKEDLTFSSSFKLVAQYFLGETGILFANGFSRTFRELAAPAMNQIISDQELITQDVEVQSELIKKMGLRPQTSFPHGTIHAFALLHGVRKRLFSDGKNIYTADMSIRVPVTDISANKPLPFDVTHDVLSRPILIDSVFPVLAHVLGPNELGYFMQLPTVFNRYKNGFPLLHPRLRASVFSRSTGECLRAQGYNESDILHLTPAKLRQDVMEKQWSQLRKEGGFSIQDAEDIYRILSDTIDANLSHPLLQNDNVLSAGRRFNKELSAAWNAYLKRVKTAVCNVDSANKLFSELPWLGNGGGQDRFLNIFSLVNSMGIDSVRQMISVTQPLCLEHQLIEWQDSK
ncbi:MAG: bacillithiol biosynthesis BshC [Fibrobacteria bacterium]|nr:bacillithiol biosynthesis BshC [Fibrobacteria bacterium]